MKIYGILYQNLKRGVNVMDNKNLRKNIFLKNIMHPIFHFRNYHHKINEKQKQSTSDEDLINKIVIRNFKNQKDESPNIIDIDSETGEVR